MIIVLMCCRRDIFGAITPKAIQRFVDDLSVTLTAFCFVIAFGDTVFSHSDQMHCVPKASTDSRPS